MRCACCNNILSDLETTAKFVEPDGSKPTRYVNMCTKCQGFLPKEVRIITRSDLEEDVEEEDEFELEDDEDVEEEE